MKQSARLMILCILLLLAVSPLAAQDDPTARSIAVSVTGDTLQLGAVALPGASIDVDFNPAEASRYARVDGLGMLRFVPPGGPEGVYSFSPYFDGFTAASAEDNELFVAEAEWSPDGNMLAFRIDSDAPAGNDGVWFWQPAREISTDPSYHILRDCPPGCNLVDRVNAEEWESTGMEWSSDNFSILVSLILPQEDNRRALTIRLATRDFETTQSRIGPSVMRFDYGHWSADGQRIILSGLDSNGQVVFGSIAKDGSSPLITPASDIGMAWVQDAVQDPITGQLVMLGSSEGRTAPLQLIDSSGNALTLPIGGARPDSVAWNRDRTAALLTIGSAYYVAQTNGTVTDISNVVGASKAIGWVDGSLPNSAARLAVPEPLSTADDLTTSTQPTTSPEDFFVGQLLQVIVPELVLYTEPLTGSDPVVTLTVGETLILTAGPVSDGSLTWWRVQTLDYSGWVPQTIDGVQTIGDPVVPTG